jgi:hypothetical protein
METAAEQKCKSIFIHNDKEKISEAFTLLWAQVINKKENSQDIHIAQANTSDL